MWIFNVVIGQVWHNSYKKPEQSAFVVVSGGGDSFNFSYGANRRFAKDCVEKLENCGFTIVHSDLDKQRKGFIARFLE